MKKSKILIMLLGVLMFGLVGNLLGQNNNLKNMVINGKFDLSKIIGIRNHLSKKSLVDYPINRDRDQFEILINGVTSAEITQGEDFTLTVLFSDSSSSAIIKTFIDRDNNQQLDEDIDSNIDALHIMDNDIYDLNPAIGIYQSVVESGPQALANTYFIFKAQNEGEESLASLQVNSLQTDYSISGSTTPSFQNIIIAAINLSNNKTFMAFTDINGNYQLFVPEGGIYYILEIDIFNVADGYFSNIHFNLEINEHISGYNFAFSEGNSTIEGYVYDSQNNPLPNITIKMNTVTTTDNIIVKTDENGYYCKHNLMIGNWVLSTDTKATMPQYPSYIYLIRLEIDQTIQHDFHLYESDSQITGTVYPDNGIAANVKVKVNESTDDNNDHIYVETFSHEDGYFSIPVLSGNRTYQLDIDDLDLPYGYSLDQDEHNTTVNGNTTGVEFHIHKPSNKFTGYIYDADNLPLENVHIFTDDYYVNSSINAFSDENGYFEQYLPNGTYRATFSLENYQSQTIENISFTDTDSIYSVIIHLNTGESINNEDIVEIRESYLSQNYPNPFNPSTRIKCYIKKGETGNVSIYNLKGELVRSYPTLNGGQHEILWNGTDNFGKKVGSGIFLYKLSESGKTKITKKCIMLK